jgi:hypothetical protein
VSNSLGVPELIILAVIVGPILVAVVFFGLYGVVAGRRARRFGYPSTRAYLRAAPRSDEERRDAADLALKGLVLCMLGLIFAPLVLVGLVPLFYGGRKLVYASMGLGLVDDGEPPRA